MSHWKLTLTYDGALFHGWQIQPGLPTIQGTLAAALGRLTGEDVLPQGSGRTDTGVHALAQVASVTLAADIPAPSLFRALNRILPPGIRVLSAEIVPPGFHARHSARRKTYEYRIFEQRIGDLQTNTWHTGQLGAEAGIGALETTVQPQRFCSPFLARYAWEYRWPLNLSLMQQAASALIGTHDFTSFAASDPDLTLRTSSPDLSSRRETRACAEAERPASPELPIHCPPDPELAEGKGPASNELHMHCHPERSEGPASRAATRLPNPIKTIHASACLREHDLLIYHVTGSGFLHHMVRNLVGTLTDIGRGAISPDAIPAILAARNRSAAGPTAPPQGLYLVSVDYEDTPPKAHQME